LRFLDFAAGFAAGFAGFLAEELLLAVGFCVVAGTAPS
jgi:hypothetical protein